MTGLVLNLSIELEALKLLEGKIGPKDGTELTRPIGWSQVTSRGKYGKESFEDREPSRFHTAPIRSS